MPKYFYGRRPDLSDIRDYAFHAPAATGPLPASASLVAHMPPVYDQGQEGSCTANMACAMLDYLNYKVHGAFLTPSRNFQYYNARLLEGTTKSDAGASIRDAIKAVATYGVAPESEWPYSAATLYKKATAKVYADAKKDMAGPYQAVPQTLAALQSAIAVAGLPVGIGISVYASFESDAVAASGVVPLPAKHEQLEGGHAVAIVGYDNAKAAFLCRNSWGTNWGIPTIPGHFWLPYSYVLNAKLASDFWVIQGLTS